jgi:hypothetical protein
MTQKHKSKYKTPKDFEKSQKPKPRKDLKDYTEDDKKGNLNPKTTGDKQLNVLRKTDKPVQDDGKMFPKYNDDDRLYKDIEDGDYDPKTAAKRLKKRQDKEEKETADVLKDKIENLTREQKERLVREYVRRKIVNVLIEQEEKPEDAPTEEPAAEEPAAEPTPDPSTPTPPAAATPPAADVATPPAPTAATPPAETPAAGETSGAEELSPETKEAVAVEKFVKQLKADGGNIARIKTLAKVFNMVMKDAETEDKHNFFKLLRQLSIKKLMNIDNAADTKKSETK